MGEARIAVFCVGNLLMLDDGVGPAVYRELQAYDLGEGVDLFDVGCMSMELVSVVDRYDVIVTVDAVDDAGQEPGTIFRYAPEDMAKRAFGTQSLHDLRLSDLFDAASLLGYEAEGVGVADEGVHDVDAVVPCAHGVVVGLGVFGLDLLEGLDDFVGCHILLGFALHFLQAG